MPRTLSSTFSLPQQARLCLLRLSAIGDVCHAVSIIGRIRQTRPDIEIVWVIGKIEHSLVAGMEGVEFIIYDKSQGKRARNSVKKALAGRTFDALCVMQVALRANWLSTVIKAKVRLGFDAKHSKEGHSFFINRRILTQHHPHVLEGFHAFADALGIPKMNTLNWPIVCSEDEQGFAEQHLPQSQKTVILCPAASKRERCWEPASYAAIAQFCGSLGYTPVLCGGPSELDKQLEEQIQHALPAPIHSFIGKTSLKQLFCLLANADLVIAPDTGPAHMATAAGTAVVGLYAHSNPRRTGPYDSLNQVVNVYDEHIQSQQGKPWGELKWGIRAKGSTLMDDITVNAVKSSILSVLPERDVN